jgi:hypothetical protein
MRFLYYKINICNLSLWTKYLYKFIIRHNNHLTQKHDRLIQWDQL